MNQYIDIELLEVLNKPNVFLFDFTEYYVECLHYSVFQLVVNILVNIKNYCFYAPVTVIIYFFRFKTIIVTVKANHYLIDYKIYLRGDDIV